LQDRGVACERQLGADAADHHVGTAAALGQVQAASEDIPLWPLDLHDATVGNVDDGQRIAVIGRSDKCASFGHRTCDEVDHIPAGDHPARICARHIDFRNVAFLTGRRRAPVVGADGGPVGAEQRAVGHVDRATRGAAGDAVGVAVDRG
jgi:hypothetical protein